MSHSDLASLRGEPSYVWRAGQERRLGMMAHWADLRDARVLVAGCGVGMYARQIRQRFTPYLDAFDIEYDRVQVARDGIRGALVSAGEALPYAASSFDVVLSHEVIEHVDDDRRSLQEMLRVAKVGGRILLFCPNRWYP
ncbi:MAG: class I SAM-dependent methyltransferase, partial [Anaerolineae bacterium]|nr:class I SAM-dependent methyltransferase [Anaerolineae bacterium]